MITGLHAIVYAHDADAARAFFKSVLGFPAIDAGEGWLVFALPPAEGGVHPAEGDGHDGRHELYLMCDDVEKTVAELRRKGVRFTRPIENQGWGLLTTLAIPGGGELGLYQPLHPTTIGAKKKKKKRAAPKKRAVPQREGTARKKKGARRR